jgi:hypothetical protein
MFADKREKNKELSPRWKRTKERTQNLVFKYKEQRAELSSWLLPSHALLFIGKENRITKKNKL